MHSIKIIYIVFFFLLFLFSCDNPTNPASIIKDNPNDPTNPNFEEPKTSEIIIPEVNGKVIDSIFTIQWNANNVCSLFSYKFDNNNWSNWQTNKFVTNYYLDDNNYFISVRSMHKNEMIEATPPSKNFIVDAIRPQSVYFFPRKISLSINTDFTSEIKVDELPEVSAFKLIISYNPLDIEYKKFEVNTDVNNILYKNNGSILDVIESDKAGLLIINLVRIGATPFTSGSGSVGRITWKTKSTFNSQKIFLNNSTLVTKGIEKINVNLYSQYLEKK